MSAFLPLLEQADDALFDALSRLGPIITSPQPSTSLPAPDHPIYLVDQQSLITSTEVADWLDAGVEKVILPLSLANNIINTVPAERLILLLDVGSVSAVSDKMRNGVSGVVLKTPTVDTDLISSVSSFFSGSSIYVLPDPSVSTTVHTIRAISRAGATLIIPTSSLTLQSTSKTRLNVADAFLSVVTSDRPDNLFPTIVSNQSGKTLGLVYSSVESVRETITTGKGVYQSRKHGLWRKGETSGATQNIVSIRLDCDSDCLEYRVVQHGAGFCHLNRLSKRLFDDPDLLQSKIMEEADELCRATTPEEVAFEAADLIYFALTKCVAAGVSISDIEHSLDMKAKKVSRRPGNAKPQWTKPAASNAQAAPTTPISDGPIQMRTSDLSSVTPEERAQLLRRPVLKSDEMINKVKPIVDQVRQSGDKALLELTAKFDKAQLTSTVVFSPFAPETMQIDEEVRKAIDVAYTNIRKFHEAQIDKSALVVETMPGVVCSRFAKPIARVGLYVPGGTAILPSTALMLGIPAQVAGCKEIVLATPPRSDGSISPEVVYVAKLVGASAILKAGGAQAVAAMAYGTETVPKVDKIFGPGNQWVTAAKMLVQNDTDALVSIDMPAGPSEVLVIADHTANHAFVAADLLSQAEHGVDSQVVLVAINFTLDCLASIEREIDQQAHALERVDIVRQSIPKSLIVKASSVEEAITFSNDYAPEHLILHLENARDKVSLIENAGSVFVGPYTPESCGDYASGTNHTLPTNGYARQFSGVNTQSYQKHITSQEITPAGLGRLGPVVATLADCEGLQAHANAVYIRLSAAQ
ncbi:Histidine biosynthesis trifunctional protein [Leucoagaricus sp. SymC.cos]|nr:Histidine biosynthesis trifunctional protein [Leucoagaricus sp. SymC.cos]